MHFSVGVCKMKASLADVLVLLVSFILVVGFNIKYLVFIPVVGYFIIRLVIVLSEYDMRDSHSE